LAEHVRRQWAALGASNPHWSVLIFTHDECRAENLNEERLQRFYASSEADANLIDIFERRAGRRVSRGRCFELGCGVGRVTKYLTQKFASVVAADISPGNLALCEKHIEEAGASNVKPMLLASPYDIDQLGDFDFFYAVISIQHNPPPVQKLLLDKILPKIRVGGGCLLPDTGCAELYVHAGERRESRNAHYGHALVTESRCPADHAGSRSEDRRRGNRRLHWDFVWFIHILRDPLTGRRALIESDRALFVQSRPFAQIASDIHAR